MLVPFLVILSLSLSPWAELFAHELASALLAHCRQHLGRVWVVLRPDMGQRQKIRTASFRAIVEAFLQLKLRRLSDLQTQSLSSLRTLEDLHFKPLTELSILYFFTAKEPDVYFKVAFP